MRKLWKLGSLMKTFLVEVGEWEDRKHFVWAETYKEAQQKIISLRDKPLLGSWGIIYELQSEGKIKNIEEHSVGYDEEEGQYCWGVELNKGRF